MAPAAVFASNCAATSSFSHSRHAGASIPLNSPHLPFSKQRQSQNCINVHSHILRNCPTVSVRAASQPESSGQASETESAPVPPSPSPPQQKQTLLEALDFSEIRSEKDAQLLSDARSATSLGEKMSREQYAALRRKIGGTYRDFFKDSVEVDGEFVDEGWVDKTCRFCKKDTASEPRTVDKFGRYAHIDCLEKSKSGNFFTRLFGM